MVAGDTLVEAPDLVNVMQRAESMRRSGPDAPRVEAKPARTLPRETSGVSDPAQSPEKPAAPPKPANPAGGGGRG